MKWKFSRNQKVKEALLNGIWDHRDGDESSMDYLARVIIISNKMRNYRQDMLDKKIVENILRTLTEKFTYVIVSIEKFRDNNMSIDKLQNSLVVYEQKFWISSIDGEEQVLKVKGRMEISNGGIGTYRDKGRRRRKLTFNNATVECYKCHDLGYFHYECSKMNKKLNYVELEEDDKMLLMAHMERHDAKRSDAWFLNSGCSNHMCINEGMLSSLDRPFTRLSSFEIIHAWKLLKRVQWN